MQRLTQERVQDILKHIGGQRKLGQRLDAVAPHAFPARMPPSLAEYLIERFTEAGDTVVDPMVGSGTTAVAARRLGRRAIGFDLDPLAVVLTRALVSDHDEGKLTHAGDRVLELAGKMMTEPSHLSEQLLTSFAQIERDFLDYWFPIRSQRELLALRFAISQERERGVRDFLWLVFSSLIIAKSAGASYALDLAHSRPHRDLHKKIAWPLEAWVPRFKRALKALPFASHPEPLPKAEVRKADARHLAIDDGSVDFVLTSPPYRQAIDYMRAHKFALIWMGHQLDALSAIRSSMIGSERALLSPDGLPASIEDALSHSIPLASYRGIIRRYVSDLQTSLKEIKRVLKPEGAAVVVVGPSIISRSRHDAPELMRRLASSSGLKLLAIIERRLSADRRALPAPGKVSAGNALRKRMRREFLVALGKGQ